MKKLLFTALLSVTVVSMEHNPKTKALILSKSTLENLLEHYSSSHSIQDEDGHMVFFKKNSSGKTISLIFAPAYEDVFELDPNNPDCERCVNGTFVCKLTQ